MIGKLLARLQITYRICKGNMGEVHQVNNQKLGEDVAMKVLSEVLIKRKPFNKRK